MAVKKLLFTGEASILWKEDIEKKLSLSEKKKFNNFLQRMKRLKVLKSGLEKGEYIFTSRLVRLYILLKSKG